MPISISTETFSKIKLQIKTGSYLKDNFPFQFNNMVHRKGLIDMYSTHGCTVIFFQTYQIYVAVGQGNICIYYN